MKIFFLNVLVHLNLKVKSNDLTCSLPLIIKVKEFYHTRMFRFIYHVLVLWDLRSFVFLLRVLLSAALGSGTDVRCWNAVCPRLKRRKTGAERKEREKGVTGDWERQGRKESLQGKWMVGMCAQAQWMSCLLSWWGVWGCTGIVFRQQESEWLWLMPKTTFRGREHCGRASRCQPHL